MVTSVRTKQRQKGYWWHGTESAIGVLRMEMGIIWNNRRGDGQKACVAGGIWWDLLNRTRWPRSGKEEIECGRSQSDADLLGAISSGHVGDDHPAPSCIEETLDRDCIAGHPVGLTRITPYVLFSVYLLSPRIMSVRFIDDVDLFLFEIGSWNLECLQRDIFTIGLWSPLIVQLVSSKLVNLENVVYEMTWTIGENTVLIFRVLGIKDSI